MKKLLSALCVGVILLGAGTSGALAYADDTLNYTQIEVRERPDNTTWFGYVTQRWATVQRSYLIEGDGTLEILSADNSSGVIHIDTHRAGDSFPMITSQELTYELPLFGGFYAGEEYYYIAFGQENRGEDNGKEVIRVVKYDKDFRRLAAAAVTDCYTTIPFDAGSLRMVEVGDQLVVHTSRERYTTEDGLNHQSQLTVLIDTKTMKVQNDLGRFQENHVSHSFNQFVLADGSAHVLLDHGDAYPRSVVLNQSNGFGYRTMDLFKIPGPTGANVTGITVGGFEASAKHYIVAINSVNHSQVTGYDNFQLYGLEQEERDVILLVSEKDNTQTKQVRQVYLTDYFGTGKAAGTPYLVKLSEDHFAVLWEVFTCADRKKTGVCYVEVDGEGNSLTDVKVFPEGELARDCQPMVYGNSILWYTDCCTYDSSNGYVRTFYEIDLTDREDKILYTIDDPVISVFGQKETLDAPPIIRSSRTLLPARSVAESLGAEVDWDGEKREVIITREDIEIILRIDSDVAYVNGKAVTLDSPACIENERTYTPVRFVAENLGADVRWKQASRTVVLTLSEKTSMP